VLPRIGKEADKFGSRLVVKLHDREDNKKDIGTNDGKVQRMWKMLEETDASSAAEASGDDRLKKSTRTCIAAQPNSRYI